MARTPIWVYNRFNVLIDRAGDPSITDVEFTEQYNLNALSVFKNRFGNDNLRNENGNIPFAWEMSDTDTVKWQPLIKSKESTTDSNGKITNDAIEILIEGKIYHIRFDRKDSLGEYRYCRFVRHNDYGIQRQNEFKEPRELFPIWRGFDTYFQIEPKASRDIQITAIKYPNELVLDFDNPANNKDTDLTDSAIDEVLWRMASAYGVQIRDQQLTVDSLQQEKLQ